MAISSAIRTDARQIIRKIDALPLGDIANPFAYVGACVLGVRKLLKRHDAAAQQELRDLLGLERFQVGWRWLVHICLSDARVRRAGLGVGPHVNLPAPVRQTAKLFPRPHPALRLFLGDQLLDALSDAMLRLGVRKRGARLVPCGRRRMQGSDDAQA